MCRSCRPTRPVGLLGPGSQPLGLTEPPFSLAHNLWNWQGARVADDRVAVLRTLLDRTAPVDDIASDLSAFPWDSETPLVVLQQRHILDALDDVESGAMTQAELARWADVMEARDDIGVESEAVTDFLFFASSPDINGAIDVAAWRARLA